MRRTSISRTFARKAGALAVAGALISAAAWGTTGAYAQNAYGAKVGEVIPHQLEVPDQTNQVQSFVTLKKNKGLIMPFSRSLAW